MVGVWIAYAQWLLPAWKIFIHSDNAVPYIMTIEPWIKQDFYYWDAERFGAVYMVFWKALGQKIFGASPEAFFRFFFAFFFVGTAFFLAAIRSWVLGVLFFLLLIPLHLGRIDEFLYPGHVYGTLYFFNGVIAYLLLSRERLGILACVTAGVVCALAYWQHMLDGALLVLLVALKILHGEKWLSKEMVTKTLAFGIPSGTLFVLIEWTRRWAREWDEPVAFNFEDWRNFVRNMRDFFAKGFAFHTGPAFGLSLLVCLVVGVIILRKTWPKEGRAGFERWFIRAIFYAGIAFVFFFNAHFHYRANERHERYFAFIVPLLLLAIGLMAVVGDNGEQKRLHRRFAYGSMVLLSILSLYRNFIDRTDTLFDSGKIVALASETRDVEHQTEILAQRGCQGVLDDYWRAYRLVVFGPQRLKASGANSIRNPIYFDTISQGDQLCIGDRFYNDLVVPKSSTHLCKKIDFDYWHCTKNA